MLNVMTIGNIHHCAHMQTRYCITTTLGIDVVVGATLIMTDDDDSCNIKMQCGIEIRKWFIHDKWI